jgi:hypothetical protein
VRSAKVDVACSCIYFFLFLDVAGVQTLMHRCELFREISFILDTSLFL